MKKLFLYLVTTLWLVSFSGHSLANTMQSEDTYSLLQDRSHIFKGGMDN